VSDLRVEQKNALDSMRSSSEPVSNEIDENDLKTDEHPE
jgi:hypothetical protein